MATAYPIPKFRFTVDWGGSRIGFTEVSGLTQDGDVIEYREGNSPEYSKIKMPGLRKYPNVVLKRGTVSGDADFFTWINTINGSNVERRTVTISLLDETGTALFTWSVINAWPINVKYTDLKGDANEVAIETLELVNEGIHLKV